MYRSVTKRQIFGAGSPTILSLALVLLLSASCGGQDSAKNE